MKAQKRTFHCSLLLSAALWLALSSACGVRAAPKPPTEPDEESRARKILMDSVPESTVESRTESEPPEKGDISEGGKEGVEECRACELRENDLVD